MVLFSCCGLSALSARRSIRNVTTTTSCITQNEVIEREKKPNYILSQNTLGTYLDVLFFTPETGVEDICDEATYLPDVAKNLVVIIPWLNPRDHVLMEYCMLYLNYWTDVMIVRYGIHDLLQLSKMREMTNELGTSLKRYCPAYNAVICHSIQGGTFIMCDLLTRNYLLNISSIIVERLACDWINLPLDGLIRRSNSIVKRLSFRHEIEQTSDLKNAISEEIHCDDDYVAATLPANPRYSYHEPAIGNMDSLRRPSRPRSHAHTDADSENPYYIHPYCTNTEVKKSQSIAWANSQSSMDYTAQNGNYINSGNYGSNNHPDVHNYYTSGGQSSHYGNGYSTVQPRNRAAAGHVFRRHSQSFIEHTQTAMTSFSTIIPQMRVPVLIFATGKDNCDVEGIKTMVSNWRFQGVNVTLRYWKKCTGISLLESHNSAFVKTLDTFLERYHLNIS